MKPLGAAVQINFPPHAYHKVLTVVNRVQWCVALHTALSMDAFFAANVYLRAPPCRPLDLNERAATVYSAFACQNSEQRRRVR